MIGTFNRFRSVKRPSTILVVTLLVLNLWNAKAIFAQAQIGEVIPGGPTVAISNSSTRIITSQPSGYGRVRVFEWSGSDWLQLGDDFVGSTSVEQRGYEVARSGNGNRILMTSSNSSQNSFTTIFDWANGSWSQFGAEVPAFVHAISANGQRIVVGAGDQEANQGFAKVWQWEGEVWSELGTRIVGKFIEGEVTSRSRQKRLT